MSAFWAAARIVRAIIEANRYLVLATADEVGRPWSSPVYFAHRDFTEFFWISRPDTQHSHNIAVRPEVGISVFDSQVAIGTGQGAYMSGTAAQVEDGATDPGMEVFSQRSVGHGGHVWTSEDVRGDSGMRLYRAVVDAHWVLAKDGQPDYRVPASLTQGGR